MGEFIEGTATKFISAKGLKVGPTQFSIRLEYGAGKKNPNFSLKRYQKKKKNRT